MDQILSQFKREHNGWTGCNSLSLLILSPIFKGSLITVRKKEEKFDGNTWLVINDS